MKSYYEQVVLLVSIIKWAVLSAVVGIITGLFGSIFLSLLKISIDSVRLYQWYFLFLPLVLFTSSIIIKYLAPEAEGHGTEKVLEAFHKRDGKIKLSVVPVKLLTTIITVAGGGSAGKEGPCVQIGAGLASGVADVLRLNKEDRKKIVICGIAAGFTAVFGTPLAGAIFAVEVLVLGRILNEYLFPALISSYVGFEAGKYFGTIFPRAPYFYHEIILPESFNSLLFLQSMLSGIVFGIIAIILIETLKYFDKLSAKIKIYKPLKGLVGGSVLVILVLLFGKMYLGLGTDTYEKIITGDITQVELYSFLLKILFTAITFSFGGSGGIFTPIFFIGVTSGAAFAHIFNLDMELFTAIGLVALLSSAANTPITAVIMSIELFGLDVIPYTSPACIVAYIISGYRSVNATQLIGANKSKSIPAPISCDFRELKGVQVINNDNVLTKLKNHMHHSRKVS